MSKKLTTEEFVKKARLVHGDKYDYSKVEYNGTHKKVIIICPIHGEFEQTPHDHLVGGCKQCYNDHRGDYVRSNTTKFIEKAKKVHGDRYDYSKVNYIDNKTNVIIICPIHGEFLQTPNTHLKGCGCYECTKYNIKKNMINTEEFINRAKLVHGDRYDYSKVEYKNTTTNVCIICPIHGEFWQSPNNHLKGCGCPYCSNNKKMTSEEFAKKARLIHGDKYDYSKVEYVNNSTPICIICPIHGEFWQTPRDHLNNRGCKQCGIEKMKKSRRGTKEEFIEKAKSIHGDKYDYSKVEYVNTNTKVCIICPIHGEFWITPHNHTISKNPQGCRMCGYEKVSEKKTMSFDEFVEKANLKHNNKYEYIEIDSDRNVTVKCKKCGHIFNVRLSEHLYGRGCPHCCFSKLELEIEGFLKENNIDYIPQFRISRQSLDFYIPKYNIGIECQGSQHFGKGNWGKDEKESFKIILERDIRKYNKCNDLGIKLLYYTTDINIKNNDIKSFEIYNDFNIFYDKEMLLKEIYA
ncbi:MAG: hypothetical protein IKT40_12200 [Bacilli bacterium]|nr:hypothetical protein [Bacilli bacterium]